jgi:hypothetical protein
MNSPWFAALIDWNLGVPFAGENNTFLPTASVGRQMALAQIE